MAHRSIAPPAAPEFRPVRTAADRAESRPRARSENVGPTSAPPCAIVGQTFLSAISMLRRHSCLPYLLRGTAINGFDRVMYKDRAKRQSATKVRSVEFGMRSISHLPLFRT